MAISIPCYPLIFLKINPDNHRRRVRRVRLVRRRRVRRLRRLPPSGRLGGGWFGKGGRILFGRLFGRLFGSRFGKRGGILLPTISCTRWLKGNLDRFSIVYTYSSDNLSA